MRKINLKKKNGFTIIEVVLVLAIAGLIFSMAFIALPQLQRTQRDAERKEDVLILLENIKKYQNNNNGALPNLFGRTYEIVEYGDTGDFAWTKFYNNYLGENFKDPSNTNYRLVVSECHVGENEEECEYTVEPEEFPNNYSMYVMEKAICSENKAIPSSNPKSITALYVLETGEAYCANT